MIFEDSVSLNKPFITIQPTNQPTIYCKYYDIFILLQVFHPSPLKVVIMHDLVEFGAAHVENGHRSTLQRPKGTRIHNGKLWDLQQKVLTQEPDQGWNVSKLVESYRDYSRRTLEW